MDDLTLRTSSFYQGERSKASAKPADGRADGTPCALPVIPGNVPEELRERRQWVAWRWRRRSGRCTKVPVDPVSGGPASANDPDTWGIFEKALRYARVSSLAGVGFVFRPDDPFAGVDLDACREPRSGRMADWALEVLTQLNSYAEVSPTGTGAKVFLRAEKPVGRNRKGGIEIYDRGRFFTVTGQRIPGAPESIEVRQGELSTLHGRLFGEREGRTGVKRQGSRVTGASADDNEILYRARNAANGEKFRRLWCGDTSHYATEANGGRSEADLALCSILAFWCGPDEARIDRLFRLSGLYRSKWERADYRALTIAVALGRDEFWGGKAWRRGTANVVPPTSGEGVSGKAVL